MGCIVFGGLEGWDGGGFLLVAFEQLLHQECDGAFALFGFADFGWLGEGAQFGMGGGFFDEFGLGGLRRLRLAIWRP